MSEIRDIYRVNALSLNEMNRILQRMGDRMDQMEGRRGTPRYYSDTIETPSGRLALTQNAWPVGAIFISAVSTNPATLLGFGTWEAFGAGSVLVGLKADDTDFGELLQEGGSKAHTHTVDVGSTTSGTPSATETAGTGASTAASADHTHDVDPASVDSSEESNLMPYVVVYMWKRTA